MFPVQKPPGLVSSEEHPTRDKQPNRVSSAGARKANHTVARIHFESCSALASWGAVESGEEQEWVNQRANQWQASCGLEGVPGGATQNSLADVPEPRPLRPVVFFFPSRCIARPSRVNPTTNR